MSDDTSALTVLAGPRDTADRHVRACGVHLNARRDNLARGSAASLAWGCRARVASSVSKPRRQPGATVDLRADREQLFAALGRPEGVSTFFERVADDVQWTVAGTHPIAGHYTSKASFLRATFQRLAPLMRDAIRLELRHLHLDGDTVVVELQAMSTTLEGAPYDYILCWVCRFDSAEPGALIVEVRAYLDSAMVAWTIMRNEMLRN